MTNRACLSLVGLAVVAALVASGMAWAADEPQAAGKIQEGKGHPMACSDYNLGKVCIISAEGKVEWEYKQAPHCNDVWALPNGNLLFVTGTGVKEVTRDKKVVFEHTGTPVGGKPSEIYACQRLADGNTFIGECASGKLLEVDPAGKIVKEINLLPTGKSGGHAFMRNARKLANGNYLVAHFGPKVVKEYDGQGKEVWSCPAPGGPHSVIRLPNGNTLIADGDSTRNAGVVEVDKEGKKVWEVRGDELPGVSLKFMTGLQRLPNGNTVMTNWLGHGSLGKSAHIIEVTPDKKVVWTYFDHKTFQTVASVQLLDVPGDATKGEVLH